MFRVLLVLLFWLAAVVPADAQRWCRSQYCNGWVYSYTNGPSGYGSYDYGSNKDSDRYQSSEQWRLHLQRWAEGAQRSAQEQQEWAETYEKLFAPLFGGASAASTAVGGQGYGYGGGQAYGANLGFNYAEPGNTVYQWSSLTAQPGRTLDRALIYKLAGQLAGDTANLTGKANEGALALIAADIDGEKELIQESLRGQSLTTALKIIADGLATPPGAGAGVAQMQTFRITQSPTGQPVLQRLESPSAHAQQVIAAKCAGCHNSQRAEGKLDLTLWPNLPPAQIVAVKARIVDPDPNRRMPKAADGSAGLPLPWQDVQAFMCEFPVSGGAVPDPTAAGS